MTAATLTHVRLCIYGAQAQASWIAQLAERLPNGNAEAAIVLFGANARIDAVPQATRRADIATDDAHAVLRAAAHSFPGEHLILLRANTALPPFWLPRSMAALTVADVLVASPLDNVDAARSPLRDGFHTACAAETIDQLCHAYGRHLLIDWPTFSPLLSAWHGDRLRAVDLQQLQNYTLPQNLSPLRAVVLDHFYVADAARILRGPAPVRPGADPVPPSALGELRESVSAAVQAMESASSMAALPGYPGLDGNAVVLHVLHDWGGGAERFVRDLATADSGRHHLVLSARGNFPRRSYGEALELRNADFSLPPLRQIDLANPIRSSSTGDATYAAFVRAIVRDFAVDALFISSLIGHSLDVLRLELPVVLVTHDFYPLWPLLHRDFGDTRLPFDAKQLQADLRGAGADFEFFERDPAFWHSLRERYVTAALQAQARIAAPSHAALNNLLRLEPRFSALSTRVIAHGIAAWPNPANVLAPPPRGKLRLVVPGRVRRGKGAELLRAALPQLREHAEIFLLGAGADGMQFFGESGVHVILNYAHDELPAALAQISPDAALLLPTVAETFSYMLSELASLAVPTIATRVGALAERIADGIDGWLVEPTVDALLARVGELDRQRAQLTAVRATLAKRAPRTLAAMAADYGDLLPQASRHIEMAAAPMALSDPTRLLALSRAAQIGEARRKIVAAQATIAAQIDELQKRAEWGMDLERDIRRARQSIAAAQAYGRELDQEMLKRSAHIESLNAHIEELGAVAKSSEQELYKLANHLDTLNRQIDTLHVQIGYQQSVIATRTASAREAVQREETVREQYAQLDSAHAQLQREYDERTRWATALDAELATLRNSASWRITKPLRYTMRQLRAARARLAYTLQRILSALRRTRSSIARRGLGGTFERIGEELRRRRAAPIAPLIVVDPPSQDFVPFALPTALTPQVSIVIPVYNKIDYTVACLRSLVEHANTTPFEVIVVDDCSQDATAERLAQIQGVRVVRNAKNLGFVGSCNAGAKAALGDYVLFLNNDTVVTTGWLEALLHCFAEEPAAGLVGAKLVYPDGRLQEAGGIVFRDGSGWNYGRFDDPSDPAYEFRREADYCSGAAILLRRDFFQQLGGFDTRYAPAYYEDTDLAFATRAAGKKVFFEPRSRVIHFEGITAGTDLGAGMKQYQVVNKQKFLEKWKNELLQQPAPIDSARLAPAAANFRLSKRVLIIDSYTPTPDQDSGSLRMVNLMRLLHGLGYRISFLPDNHANAGKYTEALQALGVEALYHPYVADPAGWLRAHGSTLDVVILSRHYVANNYVALVRLYAPQAKLIFDTVDLHYLREERTAAMQNRPDLARAAMATKASELELMRESDLTLVVSPVEQAILAREVPGARVEVLSNVHEIYGCRKAFAERHDLVFVGGFQHPPNIDAVQWFVREVAPLLRKSAPEIQFHIVGSKAPPDVLNLAGPGVIVDGYVEDIAPFMDNCRLSVAPLRVGAGVKGKVNMAMSYGLPVVASSVAVEGMHVRAGADVSDPDVLVADSPQDFAAAILRAYNDEALWNTLSRNGLENVRAHFSFDAARAALQSILPR
jgi:GT2 family glycosyltransferase